MNIGAPVQEIMELETVYLGIIAAQTTRKNDNKELDFKAIGNQMAEVVELAGKRPVLYFGARHWHYEADTELAKLAFANGCAAVATDNGAALQGKEGSGTIPHALENVYAWKYGMQDAVKESTKAFDRVIDPKVPRVALVDYNNMEIDDTLATVYALEGRLSAVRVDTCGENLAQGGHNVSPISGCDNYPIPYFYGKGVTISGVGAIKLALEETRYKGLGIFLSSGFSNPEKVKAFNHCEERNVYTGKIYSGIGAGFLDGVRCATADIIAVADEPDKVDFYTTQVEQKNIIHKIGRPPKPNYTLGRVL
jgi:nicotinate phosphoribosyltransferase